jgi:hypothetical protein
MLEYLFGHGFGCCISYTLQVGVVDMLAQHIALSFFAASMLTGWERHITASRIFYGLEIGGCYSHAILWSYRTTPPNFQATTDCWGWEVGESHAFTDW